MSNNAQTIEIVSMQLRTLHGDVTDMKRAITDMSRAITQLALIEERQAQAAKTMERVSAYLEKMDTRVSALEQKAPANDRAVGWIDKALLAIAGGAVMYFLKSVGVVP